MKVVLYYTHNGRIAEEVNTAAEAISFIKNLLDTGAASCLEDVHVIDREWSGDDETINGFVYLEESALDYVVQYSNYFGTSAKHTA